MSLAIKFAIKFANDFAEKKSLKKETNQKPKETFCKKKIKIIVHFYYSSKTFIALLLL